MIGRTAASAARALRPRLGSAVSLLGLAAALTACASAFEAPRTRLVAFQAPAATPEAPPYSGTAASSEVHGLRGDVAVEQINMDYAVQRSRALRLAELAAAQRPAAAAPVAVTPQPGAALARAATPPRPAVRMKPVYVAQIGSLRSLDAARAEWVRASRHAPILLKAKTVLVRPSLERRGRFHLIVASFEDARAAQRFCGGLHRRHLACLVMHHREAA